MKTSESPTMTGGCAVDWSGMVPVAGPCLRPGGTFLTERALDVCTLPVGARIADIGCGAGGTLEHLARADSYRLVGLDPSETLLGEAVTGLGPDRLVRGRAEALPFATGAFDALFCECVLSVLPDRGAALDEYTRCVKDGGYLVLSDTYTTDCTGQERGGGLPTKEELVDRLTGNGLTILLWEDHRRLLGEFAARMILSGGSLTDLWQCVPGRGTGGAGRAGVSYFLLVARKVAVTTL